LQRPRVDRTALIREVFRLEWLTIGWMVIEAVVALASGIAAGSLVLVAFGLDSVIELTSAGVLLWRLSIELRNGQIFSERNASRAELAAHCCLRSRPMLSLRQVGTCGVGKARNFPGRD